MIIRMFSDLGKQRRRGNIQSQFLWKVSGKSIIKSLYQSGNSDVMLNLIIQPIEGLCKI